MGKILFTGDLHFGHENVLAFDNRPFATVDEMDAELIRRWNNKVGKGDWVYVLGDLIWKSRNKIMIVLSFSDWAISMKCSLMMPKPHRRNWT